MFPGNIAHAALPQPRGDLLTITTLSSYTAQSRFNRFGQSASSGEFRKRELSLYTAYGLTNSFTIGMQPTLVRVSARPVRGSGTRSRTGLSSVELFARHKLYTGDDWVLSAQALAKLPGPTATEREPLLESSNRDVEARLLFGRSGRVWDREYFRTIEAAFRARSAGAADQLRVDATAGIRPWPKWQLIAQSFNILAAGHRNTDSAANFDLYKAQLSLVHDLTNRTALQVGGYTEYAGRNIGAGDALLVAMWLRF